MFSKMRNGESHCKTYDSKNESVVHAAPPTKSPKSPLVFSRAGDRSMIEPPQMPKGNGRTAQEQEPPRLQQKQLPPAAPRRVEALPAAHEATTTTTPPAA